MVVNAAIGLSVRAEIELGGRGMLLRAEDLGEAAVIAHASQLDGHGPLPLLRAALRMFPAGPCTLHLWLPPLAGGSSFVARLEDTDGSRRNLGTATVKGPGSDMIELNVPDGFELGHHVILLTRADGSGSDTHSYPFDVQSSP